MGVGDLDADSDSESVASVAPRYLPGTFSLTQSEGVQTASFFRSDTPSKGIPLTKEKGSI